MADEVITEVPAEEAAVEGVIADESAPAKKTLKELLEADPDLMSEYTKSQAKAIATREKNLAETAAAEKAEAERLAGLDADAKVKEFEQKANEANAYTERTRAVLQAKVDAELAALPEKAVKLLKAEGKDPLDVLEAIVDPDFQEVVAELREKEGPAGTGGLDLGKAGTSSKAPTDKPGAARLTSTMTNEQVIAATRAEVKRMSGQ